MKIISESRVLAVEAKGIQSSRWRLREWRALSRFFPPNVVTIASLLLDSFQSCRLFRCIFSCIALHLLLFLLLLFHRSRCRCRRWRPTCRASILAPFRVRRFRRRVSGVSGFEVKKAGPHLPSSAETKGEERIIRKATFNVINPADLVGATRAGGHFSRNFWGDCKMLEIPEDIKYFPRSASFYSGPGIREIEMSETRESDYSSGRKTRISW